MKVAIYIDSPNLWGMTNGSNGIKHNIDFKKFTRHIIGMLKGQGKIVSKKIFYDISPNKDKPNNFIQEIQRIGYEAIPVPLKTYLTEAQRKGHQFKSRTDQMITIHVLDDLNASNKSRPDKIILISGDSDFEFLLKKCRELGVETEIWATKRTLSADLQRAADQVKLFEDHQFLLMAA